MILSRLRNIWLVCYICNSHKWSLQNINIGVWSCICSYVAFLYGIPVGVPSESNFTFFASHDVRFKFE